MWAPAIVEKGYKYYLFFGANDIQCNEQVGGIGVAVSDRPEGPYADYLGKLLVDKIYNKAQPIDQFVFKDTNGQYYIIYGGWSHCNIAKLKPDFTGFIPFSDGEPLSPLPPKGMWKAPLCLSETASTTLCGRKAAGPAPTTR